ncbi:helix-turn-helix transcriptional regulator [Streptomyces sp. NPDC002790]|uniref:helix-turn-helix domain-containing protein n=1 Tax=Streptomyces sp. NPDC002790 TaxID=3154431 RepID=UPI003327D446
MGTRPGAGAADEFASSLRELKDRSGLSYGVLAKRLHMSTSTLHRYCNGTAVPNDYAPVERLARVCKATPQELVDLHRRWILADAGRGRKGEQGAGPVTPAASAAPATPAAPAASAAPATPELEPALAVEPPGAPLVESVADSVAEPAGRRRNRTALIAAVAAAAVLGAVVLAVNLPSTGGRGDSADRQQAAGATAAATDGGTPHTSRSASPSASAKKKGDKPADGASASTTTGPGKSTAPGGSKVAGSGSATTPLHVATRPYVYESPCSQHFLVDSEPEQVGPPATEQDAVRWANAYGAVSSGEQRVALTVQGTGSDTVVLEDLHVRVVGKAAPLAWNDYSMGVGCGGGVWTKSFDIDLDNGSPTVTVKNGQRDFPYKVSESDPEVFYVNAHSTAHDVRWELTLDWSSGSRHGTVRIDNSGSAFRTSANSGRPGYDYPLGGSEWIKREEQP